jgi:outer membrane putative beta-barrel porin/alpha-amylase
VNILRLSPALRIAISVLAVHSALSDARADPPIDTDGPDFVESTEAIGKSRFQFETGPSLQRDSRNGRNHTTLTTPTLLKYGVSQDAEARIETDGRTSVSGIHESGTTDSARRGIADAAIGLKWHAQDRNSATGAPAVAWILHVEMPTGTDGMRGRGARPSLRSVIGWNFSYDVTLGVMPGVKYEARADGHRYGSGILGIVLGKRWSDRFRTFVEASAPQIATSANGGIILFKDVGAAYLITNAWQIGGRIGWAANNNTPSGYALLSLAAKF